MCGSGSGGGSIKSGGAAVVRGATAAAAAAAPAPKFRVTTTLKSGYTHHRDFESKREAQFFAQGERKSTRGGGVKISQSVVKG